MDETANNYNPLATVDDNSCTYDIPGCMDQTANNYNPLATQDDGSCKYPERCTDPAATNFGEIGVCTYPPPPPVTTTFLGGGFIPVTGGVSAITAGWAHTCAITPQGGVQCWGDNDFGQLGNASNKASNVPVDVVGLNGGTQIVAGSNHTCLLNGTVVWCWGQNDKGQLGDGSTTNRNVPVQVLTGASSLTAGADYTCAGLLAGGVMCWGNNSDGQLGDGTKTSHNTPTLASLIQNVRNVDGGQKQTCGLTNSGQISCWSGEIIPVTGAAAETHRDVAMDRFSELIVAVNPQGAPVTIDAEGSKTVEDVSGVVDVDGGLGHVCALVSGGPVKCWGANSYGQLGNNSTSDSQTAVSVSGLGGASLLGVGRNHTCVIVSASATNTVIKCWGLNSDGQLGNGSTGNSSVPVDVKVSG
jgi:alpha-tubulin suppressor-like RCC1 family protein